MKAEDAVARIDNTVAGRCPCGADPAPGSAYCGEDCRPTHIARDTDAFLDGGPCRMRWRPDLVSAFDDSALRLVTELTAEDRREADVMDRGESGFTWRGYRHRDGRYFVRVDDGHRWVGAFTASREEAGRAMRERLERELSDARRLDPDPPDEDTAPALLLTIAEPDRHRVALYCRDHLPDMRLPLVRWLAANGVDVDDVTLGGTAEIRDGQLTVECFVRDADGRVRLDWYEPVTERRTVPLVEDPPPPHSVEETVRVRVHAPDATPEQMERIRRAAEAVAEQADETVRDHIRAMSRLSMCAAGASPEEDRRVLWLPEVDDPENPTVAELNTAVDLTPHLAGVVAQVQSTVEAYRRLPLRTRFACWCVAHWGIVRADGLWSWLSGWPRIWWRRRGPLAGPYRRWRKRRMMRRLTVRMTADTEAFQAAMARVGQQMQGAADSAVAGFAGFERAVRAGLAEEEARLELQMVTGDGYDAAMAAARERGLSTRAMVEAAATRGVWTAEHGWAEEGSSR